MEGVIRVDISDMDLFRAINEVEPTPFEIQRNRFFHKRLTEAGVPMTFVLFGKGLGVSEGELVQDYCRRTRTFRFAWSKTNESN